jgi:hypothetical protein
VTALAGAARRLAAIDPSRAGVGGLRLQLELALFPDDARATPSRRPAEAAPAVAAATRAASSDDARTSDAPRNSNAASTSAAARNPDVAESSAPTATADAAESSNAARGARAPARAKAPDVPAGTAEGAEPPRPSTAEAVPAKADAAPASQQETTPPAAPAAATGDLVVLRDRWPEIVARISAHPPTKPLIVVCRPITVEENVVTLGFPEDKAFLRQVAERRKSVLEENISAVLGRTVAVRCVATNIDVVPDLPTDEEAAWILAEARKIFGEEGETPAEVG